MDRILERTEGAEEEDRDRFMGVKVAVDKRRGNFSRKSFR